MYEYLLLDLDLHLVYMYAVRSRYLHHIPVDLDLVQPL